MNLTALDWSFVIIFFTASLGIGFWVSKKSGKNTAEYFLSGRNMPWWLLGMSMVATTFSTDTDRKSVVQGKSVDLGGRRIIKKKKKNSTGESVTVNKDE